MRRTPELTGHEKLMPLHAALPGFCLDGLGCSFIRAAEPRPPVFPLLGKGLFLLCAWTGILLLAWQWGTRGPLLFGVLLGAVNAIGCARLFLFREPGLPLRDEHLA